MNLLAWITRSVKNAVIQGFAEAAEELELTHEDAPDALAALESRFSTTPTAIGTDKAPRKSK